MKTIKKQSNSRKYQSRKNKTRKNKTRKYQSRKNKTKTYIFGYGSLISKESRLFTGKNFIGNAIPVVLKKSNNFKRYFICKQSKYGKMAFLTLGKSNNPTDIGGVLYPVCKCISNFNKREKGYNKTVLKITSKNKSKIFKKWKNNTLPSGNFNVVIYTEKVNNSCYSRCPISQKYLDIVLTGCLEYGNQFAKHFIDNTYFCNKNKKIIIKNDRHLNKTRRYNIKIDIRKINKLLEKL